MSRQTILKFYEATRKVVQLCESLGSGFSSEVSDELKLIDEQRKSDNETTAKQLGQLTAIYL